ncbi:MAG TPA: decaprenyl-phosphate phosphoribosyltransferase [Anaerolineales bacterium]|nr:decaprenyl-phosphate phosphoribosyltransferase [Anaerolineales bacterium]
MVIQTLRVLLISMRPKQWMKNVLIFTALVFDEKLLDIQAFLVTFSGFILFCLISSSVYLLNDITDVEADRHHPKKRNRPIASGALKVSTARWAVLLLLFISYPLAYLLSPSFCLILLIYLVLNLIYSRWLKHVIIIDVFVLASFYVIRVVAGLTLIEVARFSPWLYVVTTLLALYIGLGKRRAELTLLSEGAQSHRRVLDGYSLPLLDQYITIVSATTVVAYSLYTFSAPNLPANHAMMLTIPFAIYGILRYLYLIQTNHGGGAPEEELLSDQPLQITILLWGLVVVLILYLF